MFSLYLIADRDIFESDDAWLDAIAAVAPAIADDERVGLQVRIKGRTASEKERLAKAALSRLEQSPDRVLLNGTKAEALRGGYMGVHWPEDAIPARGLGWRNNLLIGASVHSTEAQGRAERAGADFAVFAPVFDPGTKPVAGVGLEALREAASDARIPVLALGGVTPERVAACLEAGASGVAVATGVFQATDPAEAIEEYLTALSEAASTAVAG